MARVVVDEIVTEYELDPKKYLAGVKRVEKATKDLDRAHSSSKRSAKATSSVFDDLGKVVDNTGDFFGGLAPLAAGAAAGVGLLFAGATKAYTDYAGFDSLLKALEAVEGGSKEAQSAMKDLQHIAQQPGLGFEESVRGYAGFRRAGMTRKESLRLVSEAGNANAFSGGSKDSFDRILLALSQMAIKPKVSGEEMMQLMEAGIPASKMLVQRFGTADGDELAKQGIGSKEAIAALVDEMAKLPRVAGGAQNTIDNLGDAFHFAMVNAGSGLAFAGEGVDSLATELQAFTDAGIWAEAVQTFADSIELTGSSAGGTRGALAELVADFMTLGDGLEMLKGNIVGLIGFFGILKNVAAWLPSNLLARLFTRGLKAATGIDVADWTQSTQVRGEKSGGTPNLADLRQKHLDEINAAVDAAEQKRKKDEDKRKKGADAKKAEEDAKKTENNARSSVPLLDRIARNTDPLHDIASQILGGGALGRRGLSRQELTEVRGGGGTSVERAARELVASITDHLHGQGFGLAPTRREV